jgi:putative transposase
VAPAPPRLPQVAHRLPLYFRKWRIDGTGEWINRALRERLRVRVERDPQPSAGSLWTPSRSRAPRWAEKKSAVTTGARRSKGRKRHLLVDTEGFVLKAKVHSAKVLDHEGIKTLLQRADRQFSRLSHLWVDAGYRGEDKGKDWVEKTLLGWSVDLVERPRKPTPEGVLMSWAREWAKEGVRRWIGRNCCLPRASRCYLVGG